MKGEAIELNGPLPQIDDLKQGAIQSILDLDKDKIVAASDGKIVAIRGGRDCCSTLQNSFKRDWQQWSELSFGLQSLQDEHIKYIGSSDGRQLAMIHFTGRAVGLKVFDLSKRNKIDSRRHFLLMFEYKSNDWKLVGFSFHRHCKDLSCSHPLQKWFWNGVMRGY